MDVELLAAYRGTVDPGDLEELRILKATSLMREALWSVIQTVCVGDRVRLRGVCRRQLRGAYREARGRNVAEDMTAARPAEPAVFGGSPGTAGPTIAKSGALDSMITPQSGSDAMTSARVASNRSFSPGVRRQKRRWPRVSNETPGPVTTEPRLQAVVVRALADEQAATCQGVLKLGRGPGGVDQADEDEVGHRGRPRGAVGAGPGGAEAGDVPEPVGHPDGLGGDQLDGALEVLVVVERGRARRPRRPW